MDVLPKPKVLDLEVLSTRQHRLGPAMLHLLAKCSHLEKLRIDISPLNSVRPPDQLLHYLVWNSKSNSYLQFLRLIPLIYLFWYHFFLFLIRRKPCAVYLRGCGELMTC
jgi:hypothetical protein